jgi:hypothetical protein
VQRGRFRCPHCLPALRSKPFVRGREVVGDTKSEVLANLKDCDPNFIKSIKMSELWQWFWFIM